jgi:hypothetical protein
MATTLLNRLIDALVWAHTQRLRIIVKRDDVRMTLYFTGHERAAGVQILIALVEAIEAERHNPHREQLEKTIRDEEIRKDVEYEDDDGKA